MKLLLTSLLVLVSGYSFGQGSVESGSHRVPDAEAGASWPSVVTVWCDTRHAKWACEKDHAKETQKLSRNIQLHSHPRNK
jgi:hypothetical protein